MKYMPELIMRLCNIRELIVIILSFQSRIKASFTGDSINIIYE